MYSMIVMMMSPYCSQLFENGSVESYLKVNSTLRVRVSEECNMMIEISYNHMEDAEY